MTDILENLIQSKVKRKLLKLFLFNKSKMYHARELSRVINEPISAVQREVKKLVSIQILFKEPAGNLINYQINAKCPFLSDLKNLILKTTTEPKDYFKALVNTRSLSKIFLYGETVRHPMNINEPIYLLIVGRLDREVLEEYLKAIMEIFCREYDLIYLTEEEFQEDKEQDKKVKNILKSRNLLILKDE